MPKQTHRKSTPKKSRRKQSAGTWLTRSFKQRGAIRLSASMKLLNPRAMIVVAGVLIVGILVVVYSSASGSPEIKSALASKCLDNFQDQSTNGDKVDSYACNGSAAQRWALQANATIQIHGKCLDVYQAKQ